jgi:hypothetical protein
MSAIRVWIVAALVFVVPAARADVFCSGPVFEHLVYSDGTLMIRASWRGDWTVICGLQSPWKGVATEVCFSWFALVTSAKVHNKQMGIYYAGDVPCNALGSYSSAPMPAYVRMIE